MKRIHIVGAHRSGTTLMLDMIASCFNVGGSCPTEMSIYEEPDCDYDIFVSKQPRDVLIIKRVLEADPDLYVIYMVRDPRAVITSYSRTHPDIYFCNLRVWTECEQAAAELIGHPRVIEVRYEELVANPDAQQERMRQAFPFLEVLHPFSEFHKHSKATKENRDAMNDVRPVSTDRLDAWKKHLPRIKAQMTLHPGLEQHLIRRGYETDTNWTQLLENVEPKFTPSRAEDRVPIWKQLDWKLRVWVKHRRKLKILRGRANRSETTSAAV